MTDRIRLAFVDDHPTLLRGLATVFGSDERYSIVATGASADEALVIAADSQPDVVILDLSMPGDVFAAIDSMTGANPRLKVIIFTAFANVEMALKAIDAGAHAFVLKGSPSEGLYEAIDKVSRGQLYISPEFAPRLTAGFRNRNRRDRTQAPRLSAREQQLVDCLLQGKSNREIAKALELTEKTVKHYMTNLMTKLNVKSRLEVVVAAQALKGSDLASLDASDQSD